MTAVTFRAVEEVLARTFLAGTAICVFLGALARTSGHPLVWAIDLAQLLFIWACVLGADQAMRRGEHIEIDILVRRFPAPIRRGLAILWLLVIIGFLGILVWYGIDLTLLNIERTVGDTPISYAFVTGAVPTGAALLIVSTLGRLRKVIRGQAEAAAGVDGKVL